MKKWYIILPLALCLVGCEPDETCRQSIHVTAGVVLRGIAVDTTLIGKEFTSWDSITVQGIDNDSLLYDNAKSISALRLPLRVDTDVTAYSLTWRHIDDTLFVHHDHMMKFISMACGCVIYHTIDSVWCSCRWMDSVTIINSTVENYEQDNIRIHATVPDETWLIGRR